MAAVDNAQFLLSHVLKNIQRVQEIFALIGLAYTGKLAFKLAWNIVGGLRTHICSKLHRTDLTRYGEWAVITGCTDGIGLAYAKELAERGLNIILISRNMTKLIDTAQELERDYRVKTHIIQADFSEGQTAYAEIAKELQDKDIGILVNNVGIAYEYPMRFCKVSEEVLWQHVLVNVAAVTMMTHIVLPKMIEKKRGAIINLSSSSAIYPLPLMAVYSATKAYVDYFTRAIQYEYRNQGIDIQCLVPFYVQTHLMRSYAMKNLGLLIPKPSTFVRSAVGTLGYAKRTTGFWSHGLQYVFFSFWPEWMWLQFGELLQKLFRRQREINRRKM